MSNLVKPNNKTDEVTDKFVDNLISNFTIVSALGLAIILLGVLRAFTEIENSLLLGVSIASFIFIFIEYIGVVDKKRMYFQLVALSAIVVLPNIPIIKNADIKTISSYTDMFSFLAMGTTLMVISSNGIKQSKKYFKETSEQWQSMIFHLDKIEKKIDKLEEENLQETITTVEDIQNRLNKLHEKINEVDNKTP